METVNDLVEFCVSNKRFPSHKEQGALKSTLRKAMSMGFTEGIPLDAVEALERSCEQVAKIILRSRRAYDAFFTERQVCRSTGVLPGAPVMLLKIFRKKRHPLATEFRREFPELANLLRAEATKGVKLANREQTLVKALQSLIVEHGAKNFVNALSRVLIDALESAEAN